MKLVFQLSQHQIPKTYPPPPNCQKSKYECTNQFSCTITFYLSFKQSRKRRDQGTEKIIISIFNSFNSIMFDLHYITLYS